MQSLESIPTWFADFTGISLEAAQAILSLAVILAVLLPIMYLAMRMKSSVILPIVFVFFLVELLLIGIGWLPFWVLIGTLGMAALAIAWFGSKIAGE